MSNVQDDELVPEQTEGFKVGVNKTIDEYQQLGMSFDSEIDPCKPFVYRS